MLYTYERSKNPELSIHAGVLANVMGVEKLSDYRVKFMLGAPQASFLVKTLERSSGRAMTIATLSKSLTLVANNHYRGKEAVNALELRARISGRKVRVPDQLLKQYPHLKEIAE